MTSAPTPRDLFGSRGLKGDRHYGGIPTLQPFILPSVPGPTGTADDLPNDESADYRVDSYERRQARPAAGYGSENVALYNGFRQMAAHEGDGLGYEQRGPARRVAVRGPLAARRRYDILEDPRQPGAEGRTPRCATTAHPEAFEQRSYDQAQAQALRKWCAGCPVRELCLRFAIDTDAYGWWGGMSRAERLQRLADEKAARFIA